MYALAVLWHVQPRPTYNTCRPYWVMTAMRGAKPVSACCSEAPLVYKVNIYVQNVVQWLYSAPAQHVLCG